MYLCWTLTFRYILNWISILSWSLYQNIYACVFGLLLVIVERGPVDSNVDWNTEITVAVIWTLVPHTAENMHIFLNVRNDRRYDSYWENCDCFKIWRVMKIYGKQSKGMKNYTHVYWLMVSCRDFQNCHRLQTETPDDGWRVQPVNDVDITTKMNILVENYKAYDDHNSSSEIRENIYQHNQFLLKTLDSQNVNYWCHFFQC